MPRESSTLKLGKGVAFVKAQLRRLRQENEIWEVGFRALPKPMSQTVTNYLGQVVTQESNFLLADVHIERTPNVNDLATLLAHATRRPLAGTPHRPKSVHLCKNPRWKELFPHLDDVGIGIVLQSELPMIVKSFGDYLRHLSEIRSAGVVRPTTEQVVIEKAFPVVACWVNGGFGHIEIGDQEGFGFIARALDYGGLVFEDKTPTTLAESLAALERALSRWFQEQEIDADKRASQ